MYRCEVCQAVSQPGQARLVHVLQREVPNGNPKRPVRLEVAREVAVCGVCHRLLQGGTAWSALLQHRLVLTPPRKFRQRHGVRLEPEPAAPPAQTEPVAVAAAPAPLPTPNGNDAVPSYIANVDVPAPKHRRRTRQ